jgi:hypothetical protein
VAHGVSGVRVNGQRGRGRHVHVLGGRHATWTPQVTHYRSCEVGSAAHLISPYVRAGASGMHMCTNMSS